MIAIRALSAATITTVALVAAGFDSSKWQFLQPVHVPESGRLCAIAVDRTLYSRMRQDLGDLRIMKDADEVPYVIETMTGSVEERECRPELLNKSVEPGGNLQITLDLAGCKDARKHSRLRIETPRVNFRQKVQIETSDDNSYWVIARREGYVFDFTQDDRKLSALTVDYPVSTRRYVRATIFGWNDTAAISGAWSAYRTEHPPERVIIDAITPQRSEDRTTKSSLLLLDLGQSGLPHDRVRLEAGSEEFHRAVQLDASDDNKAWFLLTQGTVFRVPDEESLALTYSKRHERYLRLRIFNGDNRPVSVPRVYVETPKQSIKFLSSSAGDVTLYYGNPSATPPVYDLAAILSRRAPLPETTALIGEWRVNPAYQAPAKPVAPWSERHPAVLYAVLGVAVACMAALTILFFLQVRNS